MSLEALDTSILFKMLCHADTMNDVLALALTSWRWYERLSEVLPTASDKSLPSQESRRMAAVQRMLTVALGVGYMRKTDQNVPEIPQEFFDIHCACYTKETRFQYLTRNYYRYISPSIGLYPQSLELHLRKEFPGRLEMLFSAELCVLRTLLGLKQDFLAGSDADEAMLLRTLLAGRCADVEFLCCMRGDSKTRHTTLIDRYRLRVQYDTINRALVRGEEQKLKANEKLRFYDLSLSQYLTYAQAQQVKILDGRVLKAEVRFDPQSPMRTMHFTYDSVAKLWRSVAMPERMSARLAPPQHSIGVRILGS